MVGGALFSLISVLNCISLVMTCCCMTSVVARGDSNILCALADPQRDRFYDAGAAVSRFTG